MRASKLILDGRSKTIGAQVINLSQLVTPIDPLAQGISVQLPWSRHPRSPWNQASKPIMMVVLTSEGNMLAVLRSHKVETKVSPEGWGSKFLQKESPLPPMLKLFSTFWNIYNSIDPSQNKPISGVLWILWSFMILFMKIVRCASVIIRAKIAPNVHHTEFYVVPERQLAGPPN